MAAPTVVVLDYGSGNLRSAVRAVERAGAVDQRLPVLPVLADHGDVQIAAADDDEDED